MQSKFLVVLQIDCIVLETKFETLLVRLFHQEDVQKSFVNRVGTFGHFHGMIINFAISVYIAQLSIRTGPFKVWRFSNDQLTHAVDEETLPSRQQANNCMGLEALSHDELL